MNFLQQSIRQILLEGWQRREYERYLAKKAENGFLKTTLINLVNQEAENVKAFETKQT